MKKLIISYARCSTNEERQNIEVQLYQNRQFAKANNMQIDMEFSEYVSAYKTSIEDRTEIQKIKSLVLDGQVSDLIIHDETRLARRTTDNINIIETFSNCNCRIWSSKDNRCINSERIDLLLSMFNAFFSEQFSIDLSQKISHAKQLAKEQGRYLGHKLLFGFYVEDEVEKVDISKVEIIKKLYEVYFNSNTKSAMKYINQYIDKYKTHQTLHQYMSNPKMIDIVGLDVFNKYITTRKNRNPQTNANVRTNKSNALLEGLLIHDFCKHKLNVDYNRKGEVTYRCRYCKGNTNVDVKKSFVGSKLEHEIENQLLNILNNLDKEELLKTYKEKSNENIQLINNTINILKKELDNINTSLTKANNNLTKLITSEISSVEMLQNINDVITDLKQKHEEKEVLLNEQTKLLAIEELKLFNKAELVDRLLDFSTLYTKANAEHKKQILGKLIQVCYVRDVDDFSLHLNF